MAIEYKVRYKNHCTPQEQTLAGGRYYLDSAVGRKMSGSADISTHTGNTGTLVEELVVTDTCLLYTSDAADE